MRRTARVLNRKALKRACDRSGTLPAPAHASFSRMDAPQQHSGGEGDALERLHGHDVGESGGFHGEQVVVQAQDVCDV